MNISSALITIIDGMPTLLSKKLARRLHAIPFPITSALTVLALAIQAAIHFVPALRGALALDRGAFEAGQFWRAVTGHFVHLNAEHLIWSLAVFAGAGAAVERLHPLALLAMPIWAILISVGSLAFSPGLNSYCGISALATGLFIWRCAEWMLEAFRGRDWFPGTLGAVGAAGLIVKIAFEGSARLPLFVSHLPEGYQPLPVAHALGAACGLAQFALMNFGCAARRARGRMDEMDGMDVMDGMDKVDAMDTVNGADVAPRPLSPVAGFTPTSDFFRVGRLSHIGRKAAALALAAALAAGTAAPARAQSIKDLRRRAAPPPIASAAPSKTPAIADPAARAQSVLKTYCLVCHDVGGEGAFAFDFVASRSKLVDAGLVNPGKPDASPLFLKMKTRKMPPSSAAAFPKQDEIDAIKSWIEGGAPDWDAPAPGKPALSTKPAPSTPAAPAPPAAASSPSSTPAAPPASIQSIPSTSSIRPASPLEFKDLEKLVAEDLNLLPERDRRFTRYLTLIHWINAGAPQSDIALGRAAAAKLLNSLSWNRDIVRPAAFGPGGALMRVNLNDLGWSEAQWEALAARSPYGALSGSGASRDLTRASGSAQPLLRADWFVATASRPPVYHDLLGLPATEGELELLLQLNVEQNVRQERVIRAGFNRSGVSVNNRVIERGPSPFGAYWKSYDFAGNLGRENIFENPLGPNAGPRSFAHAGTEIIFTLPNGLQAYMLANAAGVRLDKAPTAIVSDPRRPDRAVENGLSCMSCHERGMIQKRDQVRPHLEQNAAAFGRDAETALALYRPEGELKAALDADEARFTAALAQAGVDPAGPEPISWVVARYEAPVDLAAAAGELGLKPEGLKRDLGDRDFARALGSLRAAGGNAQRQSFEALFPGLVESARLGSSTFRTAQTPIPALASVAAPRAAIGTAATRNDAAARVPRPDPAPARVQPAARRPGPGSGPSPRSFWGG